MKLQRIQGTNPHGTQILGQFRGCLNLSNIGDGINMIYPEICLVVLVILPLPKPLDISLT